MKNTLLKCALVALTIAATSLLQAGIGDTITDFIASKAPSPAVKASCSFYAANATLAKGYNLIPGVKETMKNACCPSADFRAKNPNTVKGALDNCDGIEIDDVYVPKDEDFCRVAFLGGRSLSKLPIAVKNKLKAICADYPEAMAANPQATQALGLAA